MGRGAASAKALGRKEHSLFREQPRGQQWLEECDPGRWQEARSGVTETRSQRASWALRTSAFTQSEMGAREGSEWPYASVAHFPFFILQSSLSFL